MKEPTVHYLEGIGLASSLEVFGLQPRPPFVLVRQQSGELRRGTSEELAELLQKIRSAFQAHEK